MKSFVSSSVLILTTFTTLHAFQLDRIFLTRHRNTINNILTKRSIPYRPFCLKPSNRDQKLCLAPETITDDVLSSPLLVVLIAAILGISAQGFINSMISGERGLGAFLQDGSGYGRSKFTPLDPRQNKNAEQDPLPWLKLPNLDFVDVAGQERPPPLLDEEVTKELDLLKEDLRVAVEQKDMERATDIRNRLERIMQEQGYEYLADDKQ